MLATVSQGLTPVIAKQTDGAVREGSEKFCGVEGMKPVGPEKFSRLDRD